ncbi:response regulator [Paenibacillus solisilvae]|uniref:Response regulator n=1 Tax=Paenibacillus solisilvae TaxID=2486751 RepID=A0ABW0VU78_9BACL
MYKILLVDDEKLELDAIKHYIRWEDMGIVVAGTAKNGREALKVMEACKPDIILTDVRMPIMNGLEFASKAKQMDKNVKIVFLSGHDEFQYIKAALSIEAMGYLLKPIDTAELAQLMQRVILKCQEDKQLSESSEGTKEKLVRSLSIEQSADMRKKWVRRIAMLPYPLPSIGMYTVCFYSFDSDSVSSKNKEAVLTLAAVKLAELNTVSYSWPVDEFRYCTIAYLNGEPDYAELMRCWHEVIGEANIRYEVVLSVGLSEVGRYLEELHDRYGEAREANGDKFYSGTGRVIPYTPHAASPASPAQPIALAEQLSHAISHLQSDEAASIIAGFFDYFATNRTSKDAIIASTMQLISEIERLFAPLLENSTVGSEHPIIVDWKAVMEPESLEHLHAFLTAWSNQIMHVIREKDHDKNLTVIHQIIEMINIRYGQALTVEDLAEHVYLTPNYIRTLFKQKTGETILEYLTKVRIQRASDLLKDKSLKIHEVSRAIGYENVSYFCSLFQKHKGVTPNQYRKKLL